MYRTLEEFKEAYKEVLDGWSEGIVELLHDCDTVGLNVRWADAQLNNNDAVRVYKYIINRCKEAINRQQVFGEKCKYDAETMLRKYQDELRSTLMYEIQQYCK